MKDFEYIPYSKENEDEFYEQIEKWNDEDKFTRCIDVLNEVAKQWQDYRLAYALARALENYAILGDDGEGTPKYKGDAALLKAIDVLESVREEGWNKAQWNMRMAYAYQYLFEQEEKAIFYAKRWAELDPEDLDAITVINECEQEINKRKYANKRKRHEFISKDVPFENFELTDFWDDSDYALKEYVSESPSDEMIASIEEELGYKLPDSYIWLMKQHNGGIQKRPVSLAMSRPVGQKIMLRLRESWGLEEIKIIHFAEI